MTDPLNARISTIMANNTEDTIIKAIKAKRWDMVNDNISNNDQKTNERIVGVTDSQGLNALHWGLKVDAPPRILTQLIECASVETLLQEDDEQVSAFNRIVGYGPFEAVNPVLIKVTKRSATTGIMYCDRCNRVPLHYVNTSEICERLLTLHPSAINAIDMYGDTPLDLFYSMCKNLSKAGIKLAEQYGYRDDIAISVENVDGDEFDLTYQPMKISEIKKMLLLFLKVKLRGSLEAAKDKPLTSFEIFNAVLTDHNCIWFLFELLLKDCGHQALYEIDENGNTLLHGAIACSQYTDDELIMCNRCLIQLNDFHYLLKYQEDNYEMCDNCFHDLGELEDFPEIGFDHTTNNIYGKIHNAIETIIKINPTAASIPNHQCKTPLHTATETGRPFSEGTALILRAAPDALSSRAADSHMYPFMLAAMSHFASPESMKRQWRRICNRGVGEIRERRLRAFELAYEMLMECPVVVVASLDKLVKKGSKRKFISMEGTNEVKALDDGSGRGASVKDVSDGIFQQLSQLIVATALDPKEITSLQELFSTMNSSYDFNG